MNIVASEIDIDPQFIASSYVYDEMRLKPFTDRMKNIILNGRLNPDSKRAYDETYGRYLLEHLERSAKTLEKFLIEKKYNKNVARNIAAAFSLHDIGKALQPGVWTFTEEKPALDTEEDRQRVAALKMEKPKHGPLGLKIVDIVLQDMRKVLDQDALLHIDLVRYFMPNHHERIDGRGPRGWKNLPPLLEIAGLIDGIDGKLKAQKNDYCAVMDELQTAPKHKGEFNPALLADLEKCLLKHGYVEAKTAPGTRILPLQALANPSVS